MLKWLRQRLIARDRRRAASLFSWLDGLAEQKVPDVSREDVLRIIDRDFADADRQTLFNELVACPSIKEPRFQLAILKLAAGDAGQISKLIRMVEFDFRDVLGQAEYPEFDGLDYDEFASLPIDAQKEVINRDWQQYEAWLHGTARRGIDQGGGD